MADMLKLSIVSCLNKDQSTSVTANLPTHYHHSSNSGVLPEVFYHAGQSNMEGKSSTGPD
jgi:hypothetical protein